MALTKVTGSGVDGLTLSSTDLKISSGDLIFSTANKGVVLGSTSNNDANTLDDYEEGTWTPVDGSGAGLSFTQGATANYIKIGRLVLFNFYVTYPSTSSTATASIGGLPYAVTSSGYFYANYRAQGLGASNLVIQLNQGSTVMTLYSGDSGYTNATLSTDYFIASGSYMTS